MILPLKTETSNFVLIFNLQKRRFQCMDSKGQLYHSVSIKEARYYVEANSVNNLSPCLRFCPSEAKEWRRLSLPAHLVRSGHLLSSVLFCKRGTAPQTGERRAAGRWSEPARNPLSLVGQAPGEETTEEPRCEPL